MDPNVDLAKFRLVGDPTADADLECIWSQLRAAQQEQLPGALGRWDPGHRSDLPAPVAQYVDTPFTVDGFDMRRIRTAQEAYVQRHSGGSSVVLAAYSLPILYIQPEIAATLAGTARLLLHVRSRLEDTQGFVDGVMQPGSLEPNRNGQKWIRKVRLTHALVRKLVLEKRKHGNAHGIQPLWAGTAFGQAIEARVLAAVDDPVPLDQAELALVLQTFAWVPIDGLRKLGWPMSDADAANHVYAWGAVGSMLGIDGALLPLDSGGVRDSEALFLRMRQELLEGGDPFDRDREDREDTWLSGRLLTAALLTLLVQVQREQTPRKFRGLLTTLPRLDEALQQLPRILMRRLCGEDAARYLRIGSVGWFDRLVCWIALQVVDIREIAKKAAGGSSDFGTGTLL